MKLQRIVMMHVAGWGLGLDFVQWARQHCDFRSTLVDQIVTKPGQHDDPMLVISEPYHLFQGDASLEDRCH